MIGYKLTIEQKDSIQGIEFAEAQSFNCVQDINGVWFTFLSNKQVTIIKETQYKWILNCVKEEFIAPIFISPIFKK
jgi:hypothetical protein